MRDPNRIDPIIDFLRNYWKAHPDLRLGQIISNGTPPGYGGDPFQVEDELLLEGLKEAAKKY